VGRLRQRSEVRGNKVAQICQSVEVDRSGATRLTNARFGATWHAHLASDHLAKAANRLDSLLGGYDLATLEKAKGSAGGTNPL
jgi:hypothetical protein